MSGIDEQFQDIPKCPECGKKVDYWILETTFDDGSIHSMTAWLFSNSYAIGAKESYQGKHVGLSDKHSNIKVTEFTIDHIMSVRAICCWSKRYYTGPVFDAVKRAVDYYFEREGFGSEQN